MSDTAYDRIVTVLDTFDKRLADEAEGGQEAFPSLAALGAYLALYTANRDTVTAEDRERLDLRVMDTVARALPLEALMYGFSAMAQAQALAAKAAEQN